MSLHPTKLILLNGPPRSGKDTAASFIARHYGARTIALAQPLRNIVREIFGVSDKVWFDFVKEKVDKDEPTIHFLGDSFRQTQIKVATWLRETYGDDFFAVRAIQELRRPHTSDVAVVSDLGFPIESQSLVSWARPSNVLILQLERRGCSFANDSRSYVEIVGVESHRIANDYELEFYEQQIQHVVHKWLSKFKSQASQQPHSLTKRSR